MRARNVKIGNMLNFTKVLPPLAAGFVFLGMVHAQDAPAAKTETAPAAQNTPADKAAAKPATSTKSTTAKSSTTPAKPAAKTGTTAAKTGAVTLKTQKEKFSYALGMSFGASMRKQSVELDPNVFAQALRTSLAGGKTLMTPEEAQAAMTEAQNELRKKVEAKRAVEGAANKKEGDAFLAANKSKEGVVTLPSGLQYKIEKQGTGPKPTTSDTVVCNYRGTLINGTEFDSSYKRGQPATFPVSGVIKGWTEALQLMPVGSKWQLFIPSSLAYGERGAGADIGPDSTLIFEVELMSIQEKPKTEEKKQ
jgi:FKBP-type peptidyl-prolyl cis-trans isomerase FklB